jgi:diguanylate cyclase (GGDEF)-like protein
MSLFRQLWLAIISLTLFIFIGSFVISIFTARAYLEQQLSLKNIDNAEALALALSQQPNKDPVAVALVISAQFDTWHYQLIRLVDPARRVVAEHQYRGAVQETPDWFVRLFPIRANAGVAQVQDGWRQLGTLTVVSHNKFAYRELWHGSLKLLAWFLAAGLLAGGVGSLVIRAIARPLNQVVGQAQAISERRFITLAEPRTLELKSVVRAMNDMVQRLKQFFSEEATRLEALRRALNHDPVTGLANRELFMNKFQSTLGREEAPYIGAFILLRLSALDEINRQIGHGATNQLLQRIAAILADVCAQHSDSVAARLNGSDFALLVPGEENIPALAATLAQTLLQPLQANWPGLRAYFHLGAIAYHRGDKLGATLAAADQVLATAEAKGANTWYAAPADRHPQTRSAEAWYSVLNSVLAKQRLKLAFFPVVSIQGQGQALHQEGFVRLQAEHDDSWMVAGDFMPMAVRHKLTATLDLAVIEYALAALQTTPGNIAINFCAETITDWGFRNQLTRLLDSHPTLCARLCVEVTEYDALRELAAFRDLARTLKQYGCTIGIDHAGQQLNQWPQIADLGLDYLKVDYGFIRGAQQAPGDREFLGGLCKMAHAMGIQVIAEGVQEKAELEALPSLGFDGATGPALGRI